jgi:hypothetical protein
LLVRPGCGYLPPVPRGWVARPRRGTSWWQVGVLVGAIAASAAAVAVTLSADFLMYPGGLAAQKADFILGPVVAGLYWYRRRPQSRFGPMLIGFGFVGALYVLQSASNSWLFSIGLLAETVLGIATRVLILAFPTGRLDRPATVILVISILVSPVPAVLNQLLSPQTGAGASISGCRRACPSNEFAITSNPELAADLLEPHGRPAHLAFCQGNAAAAPRAGHRHAHRTAVPRVPDHLPAPRSPARAAVGLLGVRQMGHRRRSSRTLVRLPRSADRC